MTQSDDSVNNKGRAEKAAHAFNDLNMLYAILYLCENSLFRTDAADKVAGKIATLCKNAAQKQLEDYDRNMEAITP